MVKKICVVVASRANYGRIRSVLRAIEARQDLELQLIVGASALLFRFGEVVKLIERDGFHISARVYSVLEGENLTTMAKSTGMGIIELATLFENLAPDIVFTVADRFETMATAIAASYMNIGLAHSQGGEVTGSIDESVRHAISKLAHIHFTTTELSSQRLVRMGEAPETVFQVGCPSLDEVANADLSISSELLISYGGVGKELDAGEPYLVVLQHPVTTEFGQGIQQIRETLNAVQRTRMQAVWLWPNVDAGSDDISKGLRTFHEANPDARIKFVRNFEILDFARLINNCACLVGNSSSAIREGSFLGVPAVNIGTRQQGRERGDNVLDVGYNDNEIFDAIRKQVEHGKYESYALYGDGRAGPRIADILTDYTPVVQKRLTY